MSCCLRDGIIRFSDYFNRASTFLTNSHAGIFSITHGILLGFGQTTMMSSQDIVFAANDGLKPGMEAQIALAWPFLLDGRIPLQLVLDASITGSHDGVADARIWAYDFRIRR